MSVLDDFDATLRACAPTVHVVTMRRLIEVESAFNPYAIGVVGARLQHQPRTYQEALATLTWLDARGFNYSVGLAQVNRSNFRANNLTAASALLPCPNLAAGAAFLTACFRRVGAQAEPQAALRMAFSCYESGNFMTGFRDGYVQKFVGPSQATVARAPRQTRQSEVAAVAADAPVSHPNEQPGTAQHLRAPSPRKTR